MGPSTNPSWKPSRFFPSIATRVGRISLWLTTVMLVCSLLRAAAGDGAWGGFFTVLAVLCGCVLAPFLLILLLRFLNQRLLWKVRNRLIVTYLLMGLAPVVLFCLLTSMAGYIVAGQYSINSALTALEEATDQLKGEVSDVSGVLAIPNADDGTGRLMFDQVSNPRQTQMSVAVLKKDGLWHTVTLVANRGATPPSPFDGQRRPSWMHQGFHGVMVLNGKLYLCWYLIRTEDKVRVETIGAFDLNHPALNSMAASLGHVLVFPGDSLIWSGANDRQVDDADQQAQQAEQAEARSDAQERREESQEQISDAKQQAQEEIQAAKQDLREALQEQREEQRENPSSDGHEVIEEAVRKQQAVIQQATSQEQQAIQQAVAGLSKPVPTAPSHHLHVQVNKPKPAAQGSAGQASPQSSGGVFTAVSGGILPPPAHFFDTRLYFVAPLKVTSWADGEDQSATLVVLSRPSLLYTHLFATSVEVGSLMRRVMIATAIFFGLIELLALWMATRLSRTITRSVSGLYRGTTEIDKGNLDYRVKPERPDQLGALATSFNTMAGSIQDLLVQQREKERLLSELAIAQEVQGNLFPHSPVSRPGLNLHAVCLPARSVSGDYFDFIFEHDRGICIALGDISGKGISAALLMASLHSAVRAFSLGDDSAVPSPAHLLRLLNQHLLSSTQSNKYATLFLAFYHAESRRLTYANGGHLPPFLLSSDGRVQRLEAGGSVVGLLDGLAYEEATVELAPGDLLVAYTDGLTEPENDGMEFGESRLLEVLQQNRSEPLTTIVDATFKVLQQWIGTQEQPDDMTLLLARQL